MIGQAHSPALAVLEQAVGPQLVACRRQPPGLHTACCVVQSQRLLKVRERVEAGASQCTGLVSETEHTIAHAKARRWAEHSLARLVGDCWLGWRRREVVRLGMEDRTAAQRGAEVHWAWRAGGVRGLVQRSLGAADAVGCVHEPRGVQPLCDGVPLMRHVEAADRPGRSWLRYCKGRQRVAVIIIMSSGGAHLMSSLSIV